MNSNPVCKEIRFVMLLSLVCAILLGITRMAIGNKSELALDTVEAVYDILGKDKTNGYKKFNEEFVQLVRGKNKLWQSRENDGLFICESSGYGMWGPIVAVFALDTYKQEIIGLRITEQNETAGLGSEIAEEEFTSQFNFMSYSNGIEMTKSKTKSNQFDAVTGATTSSKAVERLLKKAFDIFETAEKNMQKSGINKQS